MRLIPNFIFLLLTGGIFLRFLNTRFQGVNLMQSMYKNISYKKIAEIGIFYVQVKG